jgi:hypothetical protein
MSDVKNKILGYGFILENSLISEFKRIYPEVVIREVEQTERPTIDVSDYDKKPVVKFHLNSEGFSFFRAEPGFRPKIKVPSGRKIISFVDEAGKLRYKYED